VEGGILGQAAADTWSAADREAVVLGHARLSHLSRADPGASVRASVRSAGAWADRRR
jgi:hypothetical protein